MGPALQLAAATQHRRCCDTLVVVFLRQLGLINFRCYERLELTLPCGTIVVAGRNAQGKTSLLEAAYVLATTRSPHARADRELVRWAATDDVLPYCRVWGDVHRAGHVDSIEVVGVLEPASDGSSRYKKQARVNNAARRALDVIGVLNVVLFTPRDLQLVDGPPSERRRYMDVLRCQVDRDYCLALSRYNRALSQRNHLLRQLRDRGGDRDQLAYWNDEVADHGSLIVAQRLQAVAKLNDIAAGIHSELTEGVAPFTIHYRTSLHPGDDVAPGIPTGDRARAGQRVDQEAIGATFRAGLAERRDEEIARGVTVLGPHRDDLRFLVDDVDMRVYGSRGQQRTVTLALKLAEARLMWLETGERPVLLLDDVLSELDPGRRAHLLAHVDAHQQTIITTTEPQHLPEDFLRRATLITIANASATVAPGEDLEPGDPSVAVAE